MQVESRASPSVAKLRSLTMLVESRASPSVAKLRSLTMPLRQFGILPLRLFKIEEAVKRLPPRPTSSVLKIGHARKLVGNPSAGRGVERTARTTHDLSKKRIAFGSTQERFSPRLILMKNGLLGQILSSK